MRVTLLILTGWVLASIPAGMAFARFIRAGDAIQDAADRSETLGVGGGADLYHRNGDML